MTEGEIKAEDEKRANEYKVFTRLTAADRERLSWLVHRSKLSRQEITEAAIRAQMAYMEKLFGTAPDVPSQALAADERG